MAVLILSPPPPDYFIVVCSSLRNYSKPRSFLLCGKLSNWGPHIDEPSARDAGSRRRFVSKRPNITLSFREVIKGRSRARSHRLIVFVQNAPEYPGAASNFLPPSQLGSGLGGGGGGCNCLWFLRIKNDVMTGGKHTHAEEEERRRYKVTT